MHAENKVAVVAPDGHRVVEIPGIVAVDGDDQFVAEIAAPPQLLGRNGLLGARCCRLDLAGKLLFHPVRADDAEHVHALLVRQAKHLGDLAARHAPGGICGDLHEHLFAVFCPADAVRGDINVAGNVGAVGRNVPAVGPRLERAHNAAVAALYDTHDLGLAGAAERRNLARLDDVVMHRAVHGLRRDKQILPAVFGNEKPESLGVALYAAAQNLSATIFADGGVLSAGGRLFPRRTGSAFLRPSAGGAGRAAFLFLPLVCHILLHLLTIKTGDTTAPPENRIFEIVYCTPPE